MRKAAKITKTFGEAGAVVLRLYDTWEDGYADGCVLAELDGLTVPLFMEAFERRGQSGAVVRLMDVDTVARAEMLLGAELGVEIAGQARDNKNNDHTYIYMSDMIGRTVVFAGRTECGKIADVVEDEANPLFVVDIEGREVLVPAADEFIVATDEKFVEFAVPDGLIELYL